MFCVYLDDRGVRAGEEEEGEGEAGGLREEAWLENGERPPCPLSSPLQYIHTLMSFPIRTCMRTERCFGVYMIGPHMPVPGQLLFEAC